MNKKLLRKKLALMLANLKKKRKYYCEVEYLESTGKQYIDTGLDYFADFEVGIKLRNNVSNKALGNGLFYCMQRYNATQSYWSFTSGNSYISSVLITEHHVLKWKDDTIYADGTQITTKQKSSNSGNSMSLFGAGGQTFPNMIYFCKLWDPADGTLVRDFIPVLDWDMTPCMYDRVTEQLFYNQGTGSFVAGRQIHPVDYLESTGTQYIDTRVNGDSDKTYDMSFYVPSNKYNGVFGSWKTTDTTCRFTVANGSNAVLLYFRFNALEKTYRKSSDAFVFSAQCTKNSVTVNGSILSYEEQTFNTENSIFIFGINRGSTQLLSASGTKCYYCKIYDNGTLVRDFIPAIDENGVGYMFDRVSHTCFLNQGTGSFKYPAREVEYLESDGARAIFAGITVDDTCGYDVKWMALNANDRIIMGTKGAGDSRWVLSGSNNPNVNLSWNTNYGSNGLGLNKIQTAQMNYFNDRKRILNDTPLEDITQTLSTYASTYNVGIFAGYWGATTISLYSTCRIYYVKISKGTELIRDFIPMVKDGSPCLYDKIGGEYYFGIGTGSFTVGRILEEEYE